jgi:lysyl-tRNA synthetase class 2
LRIALELHLKRLLVGGIEKVYEIGRVYRNEGISQRHNPEFTMIEIYQAYADYLSMMDLTEKIILDALLAASPCEAQCAASSAERFAGETANYILPWDGKEIDFTPPFARRTYDSLIAEYTGIDPTDPVAIVEYAKSIKLDVTGKHPVIVKNDVFEEKVEEHLLNPTFVMDYPASICPLTKRKQGQPHIAERFELFVQGMELANAYTELNDPDLQEQLFSQQLEGQKAEDSMARMDHDFVRALRHGMPPAGGLGIGIDRLCMLLTDTASIREVILFPLQRPESL